MEELEQVQSTSIMNSDWVSGYFYSGVVFDLTKKVLSDMYIKILEKGSGYFTGTNFREENFSRGKNNRKI